MIRPTTRKTGNSEFDRIFEIRERYWIRSARPGTYYLSFGHALRGWWYDQWPARLTGRISERYGRWYVRDSRDTVWGPVIFHYTARHLADQFDRRSPGLATVERKVPMPCLLRIEGYGDGSPTPFDGQYLKEYDPHRDGVDPEGQPMLAHVVCTNDPDEAMVFDDAVHVHRVWTLIDGRNPIRPDGKPNRPLTAFTVSTTPVE